MKAGVDFGSSLVKAAWMSNGQFRFASTADAKLEDIVKQMGDDGVRRINLAGIGYSDAHAGYFKDFKVRPVEGDPITNEKKLQLKGAKELMRSQENNLSNFILVSIGTGTSYALRLYGIGIPVPLGNSLGGVFLVRVFLPFCHGCASSNPSNKIPFAILVNRFKSILVLENT